MKMLLYCTKAKLDLVDERKIKKEMPDNLFAGAMKDFEVYPTNQRGSFGYPLNGKIVAECDFEVEKIEYDWYPCNILPIGENYYTYYHTKSISTAKEFYSKSCLDWDKLNQYLNDYDSQKFEGGYAIRIKDLHIFDKPRDIRNYYNIAPRTMQDCMNQRALVKAPQNMCNAYDVYKNHYVLISIKPKWLCKILNGEKTIEVRKKVLRRML